MIIFTLARRRLFGRIKSTSLQMLNIKPQNYGYLCRDIDLDRRVMGCIYATVGVSRILVEATTQSIKAPGSRVAA
jgi:hypothetical protein